MRFIVYDLEVFPAMFTFCAYVEELNQVFLYEISDRKNQKAEMLQFLNHSMKEGYYFVGYNNLNFDYPILHQFLTSPTTFSFTTASDMAHQIIVQQMKLNVWESERLIPQIDLMTLNHLDNKARRTSLKALQFAMRSETVEDLPFELRPLNDAEKDILIQYNVHDVMETYRFFKASEHLIKMRKELKDSKVIYGDVLNMSDVKIGYEYLVKEIGRQACFKNGKPLQTIRYKVDLKDVILPKIHYMDDDFNQPLEKFKTLSWHRDEENELAFNFTLRGFDYYFGIGGIHGSVESKKYESNDTHEIIDLDVTSLYPSIAIVNNFKPEHLDDSFIEKYASLKVKRKEHKKGTPMNALFKLALNGGFYGKTNDQYSAMYDPKCMLSITINGQLQLLQLAECMSLVPGLEIIQINTDGITCYVPKESKDWFEMYKVWWQGETSLELEEAHYAKMWIKDVNNYLALDVKGKVKAKGKYWYPETPADYDGNWHKDFSGMAIQKAIQHVLLDGLSPEYVVKIMSDPFDFCMRYKTPSGSQVFVDDKLCSKTVRYYVSTKGGRMFKRAKPKGEIGSYKRKNGLTDRYYNDILKEIPTGTWDERIHTKAKTTYTLVETDIESGRKVKVCNDIKDFNFADVDFDYYIKEVEKLLI